MEQFLVNHPDYWKSSMKPRGFQEFVDMIDTQGRITGIWEWKQWDPRTGEVRKREWNKNVVTDNGAIQIFQAAIANAVPAAVFNNIYINNNSGSTQLTTALTSGQTSVVSLAVNAIPAAIPLDYPSPANSTVTQLTVGYGTAQTQVVSMGSAASQAATSLTTVSYTSNAAYAIGTSVVPLPNVAENPTNTNLKANQSSVKEMYSGNLSSGAFTYTATTGAGNRSCQISFTFKDSTNGGSTPDGVFTDAWLVNVSSAATTNNYVCHEINSPMTVNTSNNVTVTITIKL